MSDLLVKADNVSKRFCRSLKRSIWYGLQDLSREAVARRHVGSMYSSLNPDCVKLRSDEFWALNNISFELRRGECLGLVGRNGAGKTTLLRILNGLIKPDTGSICMRGKVSALIALGAGFNPILTGRENIYVSASIFGIRERELNTKIDEIIDFAEVEDFIDSPVQSYSSGMQARLGFAVASALSPDIILLDEVLAVGDTKFRMKCFSKLLGLIRNGTSAILVSHNAVDLQRICTRGLFLSKGETVYDGPIDEVLMKYEGSLIANQSKSSVVLGSDASISARLLLSESTLLETGKPLNLLLQAKLNQSETRLRLVLHISNHLTHLSSVSSLVDNDYLNVSAGESTILIDIECLALIQGAYNIWVDLYGERIEDFICSSPPVQIHVRSPSYDPFGFGVCHIYAPKFSVVCLH